MLVSLEETASIRSSRRVWPPFNRSIPSFTSAAFSMTAEWSSATTCTLGRERLKFGAHRGALCPDRSLEYFKKRCVRVGHTFGRSRTRAER